MRRPFLPLVGVLIACCIVVIFGCARQASVEAFEVAGTTLALVRTGQGGPTVVYEAGAGPYSGIESGEHIRNRLGSLTSVVTYARAGRSPSGPATSPRTLTNVTGELHALLAAAGCHPPYVLVGGSLGGLYVRAFALRYPDEVAGLILVESAHERLWFEADRLLGLAPGTTVKSTIDTLRARPDPVSVREMEDLAPVWASGELGLPGKLPDVPLVVITGLKPDRPESQLAILRRLHGEVFGTSTRGMHIVSHKSGHTISSTEPELVINAVRWVLDAAREQKPSP